jgi:hypothetical protein
MKSFYDLLAGIHDLILSIAIVAGGIWTLVTFRSLKAKNKAEAELSEILVHIEKQKRELVEEGILEIDVFAKQEAIEFIGLYCISIVLKCSNKGNRITELNLTSPSLISISEVIFDSNGNSSLQFYMEQGGYNTDVFSIRAGAFTKFPYFVNVKKKGLFKIDVFAKTDERDNLHNDAEIETHWTGSTFINIK